VSRDAATGSLDGDLSDRIRDQVRMAHESGTALEIVGSGSKSFYGRPISAEPLPVAGHSGIVSYEPSELVLTARCGTPVAAIEAELTSHRQMLGFEPPHFGPNATLGGAVASGLSGPRRPFAGSVRDFVLGVKMVNGQGDILSFGGQVMKNVAGFDMSRLMVGALGTLGVLLEVSLKVLPRPEQDLSLAFEMDASSALAAMNRWAGEGWPLSAACHDGSRLWIRLSGAAASLARTRATLGGDVMAEGERFWDDLREQRLAYFEGPGNLWRLSMPSAVPMPALAGRWVVDWGGALRWLRSDLSGDAVFAGARDAGGHATLFRGEARGSVFQPLPPGMRELHIRLKKAFDPKGVFNPGRMYADW